MSARHIQLLTKVSVSVNVSGETGVKIVRETQEVYTHQIVSKSLNTSQNKVGKIPRVKVIECKFKDRPTVEGT